jgi:hypothetical protein
MLVGVTPAIERYRSAQSILGERFFKLRPRTNLDAAISKAEETGGREVEMRNELSQILHVAISYWGARMSNKLKAASNLPLADLAQVTAQLRSEVARDRYKQLLYSPEYEVGTRLVKQLSKLCKAGAVLYDHETVGEPEYQLALRVCNDSIPIERQKIISVLLQKDNLETDEVARMALLPLSTTKLLCEDMWLLKVLKRQGDELYRWKLTSKVRQLLTKTGLSQSWATQIGEVSTYDNNL